MYNKKPIIGFIHKEIIPIDIRYMSFGKLTYDNTFNKPFFWVDEFLLNNYVASSNHRAKKLQMYQRYKDYAKKHSKGKLTFGEFHNEIIKQPNINCITVKGEEYYTNCLYEPTDPSDDDFYRYENSITSTNR